MWVPLVSKASVAIAPNGFHEVNLPVVEGSEMLGRVLRDAVSGTVAMPGVPVVMTHLETGRRFETLTFHDGAFYFLALPPGDYTLTIPQGLLDELGLIFDSQPLHLRIGGDSGDDWENPAELLIELWPLDPWSD
jgi:hypothetical protein